MEIYGYVRISSARQRVDRQIIDLQSLGVPTDSIFIDRKSGKDFNRPSYRALVKKLRRGDLLYIKSIDQLGRNTEEVQEQWRYLTREKGVDIAVIDTPCLDTRIKNDSLWEFVSRVLLYAISFLAENERMVTRKRQAEGIKAAKRRGVRFGRARKPLPENFIAYRDLYLAHKLTVREAAELCGMAKSTFADAVKRSVNEEQAENQENKSENKDINAPKENKKSKEKKKAKPAPPKPKKTDKKAAEKPEERALDWTKFLSFEPETPDIPFTGMQEEQKSVPKSRKKTRKRKKPAENKQISVRQPVFFRTIFRRHKWNHA